MVETMDGWPITLAWVIIVISLSVPVLYFLGAVVVGIRRLFSRSRLRVRAGEP